MVRELLSVKGGERAGRTAEESLDIAKVKSVDSCRLRGPVVEMRAVAELRAPGERGGVIF